MNGPVTAATIAAPTGETPERVHGWIVVTFGFCLGFLEGPAQVATVALLVSALMNPARGLRAHPEGRWLAVLFGIWLASGLVAWAVAGQIGTGQDHLRPLHVLALPATYFGLHNLSRTMKRRLVVAFLVACTLNAIYGYLQTAFGALPLDALLMKNPDSRAIFLPGSRQEVRCASGLFYNRLKLAHTLAPAVGLCVFIGIYHLRSWRRWALFGVGGLLLGAIVLAHARMALVALLVSGAIIVFRNPARLRARYWLLVVVGAGVLLSLPPVWKKLVSAVADLAVRRRILEMAVAVWSKAWVFGVGHGGYVDHAGPTIRPGMSRTWSLDAHNLFLHPLAETGWVGGIAFALAVFGTAIVGLRRFSSLRTEARWATWVTCFFCCLGLVHYPLHHAPVAILFFGSLGIAAAASRPNP